MKKVYVMLGVVVVLAVVAFVVNYDPTGKGRERAPTTQPEATRPPAIEPTRVHAIEISDAESRIRVARSGEKWVLPDKYNVAAMDQRANDLLKGLQGLDKATRVANSAAAARDKAFGLEPEVAKRIKVFDESNKVIADLWVGKPDMSGERTVQLAGNFVRLEGSDAVYSHKNRLQHLVMPHLSMWMEGRLFPMEQKELDEALAKADRITIEYDDVPLTPGVQANQPETRPATPAARIRLVLEGKDAPASAESAPAELGPKPANAPPKPQPRQKDWTLVEPADAGVKPFGPMVDQILRPYLYGRADDVVAADPSLAEFGLDRPFVEVDVRFADGSNRRLRVGNRAPAPSEPSRKGGTYRYAHVDGIPRVVLVNEYMLTSLRKKATDLKEPEAMRAGGAQAPAPIELPTTRR